jgi:hypothetical protein
MLSANQSLSSMAVDCNYGRLAECGSSTCFGSLQGSVICPGI